MRILTFACSILILLGLSAQAQELTPAGTPIRNQASATYTGADGQPAAVFSGVAQSTVQAVYGFSIKPDAGHAPAASSNFALGPDPSNDRSVVLVGVVSFAYTLNNTGNATDAYNLALQQASGDDFDLLNPKIYIDTNQNGLRDATEVEVGASVSLPAGASVALVVEGQVPASAINNTTAKLDLLGRSLNEASLIENNNISRVRALNDANLSLNKEARVLENGRIRYRLFGQNLGTRPARSSPSVAIVDGVLLDGILIADTLPSNTSLSLLEAPTGNGGSMPAMVIYFRDATQMWSITPDQSASRVGLLMTDANPTIGTSEDVLNTRASFELIFSVLPKANVKGGSAILNTGTVQYRDGGNSERETASNTTNTNAPAYEGVMIGPLAQPSGAASGTYNFTDPSTLKTWNVTRLDDGSNQTDQQNISSSQGASTISFVNTLLNTGNVRDTFSVTFDANHIGSSLPAGASVEIIAADGVSPIGDGISLEPGQQADVIVRLKLPTAAPGGNQAGVNVVIRSTSQLNPAKTDITRNGVGELPKPAVLIGPLGKPDASEYPNIQDRQYLEPFVGANARFPHTVRNSGNVPDVLNLSLETPLPVGWTVRWLNANGVPLIDSNLDGLPDVGLLDKGAEVNLVLEIVPLSGTVGDNNGAGWSFVARVASSADRNVVNRTLDLIARIRPASEMWSLSKSVSAQGQSNPNSVAPNELLEYQFQLRNRSVLDQHNLVLSDLLNPWLEAAFDISSGTVQASTGQTLAVQGRFDVASRSVIWTLPVLPGDATVVLGFKAKVRSDTPDAIRIPNQGSVLSDEVPAGFDSNQVSTGVISPILKLSKTALEGSVQIGGLVHFELLVRNNSPQANLQSLELTDFMPLGLIYRAGSSSLEGQSIPDPEVTEANGVQVLRWKLGDLPTNVQQKLRFATIATPAFPGEVVNKASAKAVAANGQVVVESNQARAGVKKATGLFSERAVLLGRVYFDTDGNRRFDPGRDEALPNARVYLSSGRYAITDAQGLYSFPDLEPGRYALRLDPLTVPFQAASLPDDLGAPGTRTALIETGLEVRDFPLLPPNSASTKVRSTSLKVGGLLVEKRLSQGGAGYAVTLSLSLDRAVAKLSLMDPLPTGGSNPCERREVTLSRLDANGQVLETVLLKLDPRADTIELGDLKPGVYVLRYALWTDLIPDLVVTDPDLVWNEIPK